MYLQKLKINKPLNVQFFRGRLHPRGLGDVAQVRRTLSLNAYQGAHGITLSFHRTQPAGEQLVRFRSGTRALENHVDTFVQHDVVLLET